MVAQTLTVEISNRFERPVPCEEWVYSRVPGECEMFKTRVYRLAGKGEAESLRDFVEDVLVDPVSQDWTVLDNGDESAQSGFDRRIDVRLKPEVLDLEEEYLLDYCQSSRETGNLRLDSLRITSRYYVFLDGPSDDVVQTLVRDLANPVIHEWNVA